MNNNDHSLIKNQKGQALVEIAITLPVFFLLILGFLQLGIAIEEKQKLLYATNYATQIGSLTNNDLKISGALEEFLNSTNLLFSIENKSAKTGAYISSINRRYNDILTIQTEIPFNISIPFMTIPIIKIQAVSSARILCINRNFPYTCE